MKKEVIDKLLQGTEEDIQIAMIWIFRNLDTNRRGSTYIKEYSVGNRKGKTSIVLYNNKYMINTGWYHLVFSKKGNIHYKRMLGQNCDLLIKIEDI